MCEKLVSIIIPFFNRIHWLLEAVESVQKQTYSNWELILVNDGSTDDISAIYSLVQENPRIQLIEQKNAGVAAARNAGIAIAQGYYIALLDSDDLWDPHKLEKQIGYMEKHGYLVSHTCYTLFNETGTINEVNTGTMEGNLLKKLIVTCPLNTSSAVAAKSLIDNITPPFQVGYHYGEDACFWISLAAQTDIGAIREPLTFTRQTSTRAADDLKKVRTALVNILGFVLRDSYLSRFSTEIDIVSKKISQITEAIEIQQEQQKALETKLKDLESTREKVKKSFEKIGFYPKVSIIIPVYNGSNYVRDAIDSALTQTYGNIEVIVVNDGSTDNGETENVIRTYGTKVRYFSKPNGGVATALNLGIENMWGEYFSWLSHDDMYTPQKVENEVHSLALQEDRTTIIAEGYQVVDASGAYMYRVSIYDRYSPEQLKNAIFLLMRGGINGCALLIHKSHFERVGMFDPRLPTTQDYDLWFRMFRNGTVHYLDSSNVLSRSHEKQGSKYLFDEHISECDKLWIGMMEKLTLEEKQAISGSEYKFYYDLWEFLRTSTGYHGAMQYAYQKTLTTALAEYEKSGKKKFLRLSAEACGVTPDYMQKKLLPLRRKKSSRPRIVFQLMDRNARGGLNRIVVKTADMLSEQYDVIISSWGQPYIHGYESCPAVEEIAVDFSQEQADKYLNLLALLKADIYIYNYCCYEHALPLLEQARLFGMKTIAWSHEDYFLPYWRTSLRGSLSFRKKYLPQANAVIWLNSLSQALYGLRNANGVCIPNSSENKSPKRLSSDRGNVLIAVGRFDDARKGIGDLLRIFSYVYKHKETAELYIVGTVDLQLPVEEASDITCEKFISMEGINRQHLHLIGWTEDVDKYYQKGALHIMTSLYEGFGLVVLEAAANGTPTIAYGGSGMQDIITNQENGIISRRGDWIAMAKQILYILDHPEMLTEMQKNLPSLLEKYSSDNIRGKWTELLDLLCYADEKAQESYFKVRQASFTPEMGKRALEEIDILGISADLQEKEARSRKNLHDNGDSYWEENYMTILNSTSWKITKPLRCFGDILKNILSYKKCRK